MVNIYLVLAYSFLWLIFVIYAWSLSQRQARLRHEIEELKSMAESVRPSSSPPSRATAS